MLCSCTSSLVTVAVMNPVDVVRTRVYNQPTLPSLSSPLLASKDYYTGIFKSYFSIFYFILLLLHVFLFTDST
jgi:hypothetical protein